MKMSNIYVFLQLDHLMKIPTLYNIKHCIYNFGLPEYETVSQKNLKLIESLDGGLLNHLTWIGPDIFSLFIVPPLDFDLMKRRTIAIKPNQIGNV